MNKKIWAALFLLCPILTGCSSESVSDRLYAQAIGLSGNDPVQVYMQTFDKEETVSMEGCTAADAFRNGEASEGGTIFTGHTELLCVDQTFTPGAAEDLLFSQGFSPACKLLYTDIGSYFSEGDGTQTVQTIRMAEKNGFLPVTDLATALEEWLGSGETALLPAEQNGCIGMVFLHRDGTAVPLSDGAVRGMYWLRRDGGEAAVTLQTENGVEELSVLHSTRRKIAQDGTFLCTVTIYAQDCPDKLQKAAEQQILSDCWTAVQEMLAVHADVIGIEELLGELPEQPEIRIETVISSR